MTISQVSQTKAVCKCCSSQASLYGVCDFHKHCAQDRGVVLETSGIPIYYYRCPFCGFLFTTQFDTYGAEDLKKIIYNEEYLLVDPDFVERRPAANAKLINKAFGKSKSGLRILDFGGGNGLLARRLRNSGFTCVETYDPFHDWYKVKPEGHFDLIIAFEVVEHVADPRLSFSEMLLFLGHDGLIMFSTLLQPKNIDAIGLGWWYIGPRNGHISIHTNKSLKAILDPYGLKMASANANLHCVFRRIPEFAKHLFPKAS